MTNHVAIVPMPIRQSIAKRMPAAVATPFPPLKRENTGNMGPRTTASATSAIPKSSMSNRHANRWARNTASQPFAPSPTSVRNAASLLPVRKTFVAPGLREPYERGSGRPNALLTITANDTDPMRYAATTNAKLIMSLPYNSAPLYPPRDTGHAPHNRERLDRVRHFRRLLLHTPPSRFACIGVDWRAHPARERDRMGAPLG